MKNVGIIYDEIYSKHNTGNHPEKSERVLHTIAQLKELQLFGEDSKQHFKQIKPRKATYKNVKWSHSENFISKVEKVCKIARETNQTQYVDYGDTIASADTLNASLYAVGGNFEAIDNILSGNIDRGFVLCRPPGHHSNLNSPRGFCIFNNITLAVNYLIREKGIKRIGIVDFDAHAGNGTEDILNMGSHGDGEVLFFSLHQHPKTLYPGTCFMDEIGTGIQKGKLVNLTFLPYSGQKNIKMAFNRIIDPLMSEFKPEFILMSAGYDAHKADMLTQMGFMDQTYSLILKRVSKIANENAGGRMVATLEGGYNLEALGNSISNTINSMADDKNIFENENIFDEPQQTLEFTENDLIPSLKENLSKYWKCFD